MITSKIATAYWNMSDAFTTGYSSFEDAEKSLSEDWPITTLRAHNVIVMADYDGCRLILQRELKC